MRYLVLALFLLALGTLRAAGCGGPDCWGDSDCNDGNPCTDDVCGGGYHSTGLYDPDDFWSDWCTAPSYYCLHHRVDDGTSCEVDGQTGVCESGECRLEGEIPDGGA